MIDLFESFLLHSEHQQKKKTASCVMAGEKKIENIKGRKASTKKKRGGGKKEERTNEKKKTRKQKPENKKTKTKSTKKVQLFSHSPIHSPP